MSSPTEVYYRSRRNLALVSGFLLLDNFAGITHSPSGISLFPFSFEKADLISPALFSVFLYESWQYWTAWYSQSPETREHFVHRLDCVVVGLIFAICFTLFWIKPVCIEAYYFIAIILFLILSLWFLAFFPGTVRLRKREKEQELNKESELSNILMKKKWVLIFNPGSPNGYKFISFEKDGAVGNGKNKNETRWRISGSFLEILNSEGKIFSRFRYNNQEKIFEHTNDEDTISIRNQRIFTPDNLLWELRSKGISIRNRLVKDEDSYQKWFSDFMKWRKQVIDVAKIESNELASYLERLDRTRPSPVNVKPFSEEHALQVRNMSEILARLQEFLEKKIK